MCAARSQGSTARNGPAARLPGARKSGAPANPSPQLATRVDAVPTGGDWIHEIKFDGYRLIADISGSRARLLSRNGKDWTSRFGRIAGALAGLHVKRAILDGEAVIVGNGGGTSFRKLQEALSAGQTDEVVFQAFDLLYLDGYDLGRAPLVARKGELERLLGKAGRANGGRLKFVDHLEGQGEAFFEQACGLGLEGIISKKRDAPYRSGRGTDWLKVKCVRQDEFLIGGYTEPAGSRAGFGSLLLGAWVDDGQLRYAGRVGTGFTDRQLRALLAELKKRSVAQSPFDDDRPARGAGKVHWVRPELIADVEFTEWTRDGSLRHPVFRGLRDDKSPAEIRLEAPPPEAAPPPQRSRGRNGARRRRDPEVAGIRLTNPDRVLYPGHGITKLRLAQYYESVAERVVPALACRPLALVRCPEGHSKECFFQKHPGSGLPDVVRRVRIEEKKQPATYLYVDSLAGIVALVQLGVLEFHVQGCRADRPDLPDLIVFDLDPDEGLPWIDVVRGARELAARLDALDMPSFARTTGGKGLHLVVPLVRRHDWDEVKSFARAVAEAHAGDDPERYTAKLSMAARRGRIFIDYLRNGRGATAIASWSTRARAGATVSVPVRRDELGPAMTSDRYTIGNLGRRLAALRTDPWAGFEEAAVTITRRMRAAVGLKT